MLINKDNKNLLHTKKKLITIDDFEIYIVQIGIKQQLELEKRTVDCKEELVPGVVHLCCVDENGDQLFTPEDIEKLPTDLAVKIFNECIEYSECSKLGVEERAKKS